MSRNRATLIALTLCGLVALAATAPVQSRGGDASKVRTLQASTAVMYENTEGMETFDKAIRSAEQERYAAQVAAYVAAVQAAEAERLAAEEAARAEEAREEAARAASPPPTRVEPPPVAREAGPCGGWGDLIAAYFPGEEGTACRVMMCESGGNPTIHNRSSTASGLWQFLDSTWESTTGTPGPAANYSAETQTAAAAKLRQSSGWGQWSCF
jgi:hypothetical protein